MTGWLKFLLCAWLAFMSTAAPANEVRLAAREAVTLPWPGASAVFAVDPGTVEVSLVAAQVVLLGRYAGQTLVSVVMPDKVETIVVHVTAPPPRSIVFETAAAARSIGSWEASYDSATRRLGTGVSATFRRGEQSTILRLQGIRDGAAAPDANAWSLPSASLEIKQPGRAIVFLDERIDSSPLTLHGSVLRGVHLRQDGVEVHAGIASRTPWNDFLLPASGDRALGVSARTDVGGLRLVPGLVWLPDSGTNVPGALTLGLERGALEDPVRMKAELGWSDKPGASVDLAVRNAQREAWLQGAYRPAGFAALGVARAAGTYLDGAWSEKFGQRTTAGLTLSANRLDLEGQRPQAASARLELRHAFDAHWSTTAAASNGIYSNTGVQPLRRSTLSLGTAFDSSRFGVSGLYRFQQTSAASAGGHGGRLTLRGSGGGWRANLYVDAQQQAATVDLVFRDRPDLARAFAELGLVANTPEEAIRQLRDNAALLAARGVSVAPLVLDSLRIQSGSDVSWRNSSASQLALGLRLLLDERHGAGGASRSLLGSLYANWRINRDTELGLALVRWTSQRADSPANSDNSVQLTFRTGLSVDGLAAFGMTGGGLRAISGQVFRDERANGKFDAQQKPLAGIEVVLDGWRRMRTDAEGRFVFDAPGRGGHRVEALLPPDPGAYFTTPSSLAVAPGGEARFGITFSAARISGVVRSDAGRPIAGVAVLLDGMKQATTSTNSSGAYRFAAPAGEVKVMLAADSVPAGYELAELSEQVHSIAPGAPVVADFVLRAQRVLKGVVVGAGSADASISVLETGRVASANKSGQFLLRGLAAGPLTLVVKSAHGETRRVVTMPAEPGTVAGIELAAPCAPAPQRNAASDACMQNAVNLVPRNVGGSGNAGPAGQ